MTLQENDADPASTTSDENEIDETTGVLAWYRSRLNLSVLALAIALLAGGIGYVVGNNRAIPDPNATDIGFLQDMRFHHEQAIEMSFIYLNADGTNGDLQTIAREIVIGQQLEIGRMIQLLRDFGKSEINETDVAMTWMGDPIPLERMPGLAIDADMDALRVAGGSAADTLFVRLMIAHHQGGIHMAEDASTDAGTSEVRRMAAGTVVGQQGEIEELQVLLAKATAS